LLAYSSVSSIFYIEKIKAQSNNPSWANQVEELNKSQRSTLFYTNPKIGKNNTINKAIGLKNTLNPYGECVNNTNTNMYLPQGLNSSSILYLENQLAKPKSWNSIILHIFLFRTNEFIEIDSNNISMSFFRIADFIRNRAL